MKNVMADPRLQPDTNPMAFDGKRLIYGGFEMIVDMEYYNLTDSFRLWPERRR